eukprot:gene9070-14585_t
MVEHFLTEEVVVAPVPGIDVPAQIRLYTAAFWGLHEAVKELLVAKVDVNIQNEKTGWTPMHAAAFQEHGRCVELLLNAGARHNLADSNGCTAADFASCSDKVWGHFALAGAQRRTKKELLDRRIITKVQPTATSNAARFGLRSDSGYRKLRTGNPTGGDILEDRSRGKAEGSGSARVLNNPLW